MKKTGFKTFYALAVLVVAAVVMGILPSKSDRTTQVKNAWGVLLLSFVLLAGTLVIMF